MSRDLFIEYLSRSDARADPDFTKYEVVTDSLGTLSATEKRTFLAVGLKGTGKSSAFKYLEKDRDTADVIQSVSADTQEPQDLPTSRQTRQYLPEVRTDLVLQALTAFVDQAKTYPDLGNKVPRELRRDIERLTGEFWKGIKEAAGRVGGFTILGFGISFRATSKAKGPLRLVTRDKYEEALTLLKRLAEHASIRIVVDDPEALFAADDKINDNLVAALVLASHELGVLVKGFKCIILIKPNVLRALRRVDEFPSLPIDVETHLTWSDQELRNVVQRRAEAAGVRLADVFGADPGPTLGAVVNDSRSGPRDVLRRLEIQLKTHPDRPVTPATLADTIDRYASACFEQMYAAYEKQFPGIARASLLMFEGLEEGVRRSEVRRRLEQMIATSQEIIAYREQAWVRDHVMFTDLLVEFGLVAVKTAQGIVLPFHAEYLDEAGKSDARFVCIPGLRSRVFRSGEQVIGDGTARGRQRGR